MSRNTKKSGTTANKPTVLYEGQQYLDTELGVLYIGKADNSEISIPSVEPGSATGLYLKWNDTTKKYEKKTLAELLGVKKYVAKITQAGTAAPTVTVLVNTLGVVPTFTYGTVGNYVVTATGALTVGKTVAKISFDMVAGDAARTVKVSQTSINALALAAYNSSAVQANDLLTAANLEIEVYD